MTRKTRVYVAGKYSDYNVMDVLNNIRKGAQVCVELLLKGYAPFCPWLDAHLVFAMSDEQYLKVTKQIFYEYSITWLHASDVLLIIDEMWKVEESGVWAERQYANEWKMPIYYCTDLLYERVPPTIDLMI